MRALRRARSTSESVETSAQTRALLLLVVATIVLIIALFLPWWTVKISLMNHTHVVVSTGFTSWGWLSFTAWLVALATAIRSWRLRQSTMSAPLRSRLDGQVAAWVTVAAGVAELLGNVLFVLTAPKTRIGVSSEVVASHGEGLVIAIACGLAIAFIGLLMLTPYSRGSSTPRLRLRLPHLTSPARRGLQLPCPD